MLLVCLLSQIIFHVLLCEAFGEDTLAPFKVFISVFNLVELLQLCRRNVSWATDVSWAEEGPGKHNLHFWQPLLKFILTLQLCQCDC